MSQRRRPNLLLLVCLLVSLTGCHRQFYRHQADHEVYSLLHEKAHQSQASLHDFLIDRDPRSRMFDPFDPDRPPMPLDDPNSHRFMHVVDHKKGYPFWDINGETQFVENPEWKSFLPLDEKGVLKLDSTEAVKLALIHSPDYQLQLENLYLSALDVSAERFSFDTQFFAGHGTRFDAFGRLSPDSITDGSSSVLDLSTRTTEARRFFATGASAVVGLANSLIWQFSGPDSHTGATLVNFSVIQPLLQRAGRDRILESLTFAERSLLANVRQMERYQRGFYLDVVAGNGLQGGPERNGIPLDPNAFRDGAARIAGGYLGLLQDQQRIRNQEITITALRSSLAQLEAFREAGRIDFLQVEQTRQELYANTSQVLERKRGYADRLDVFKQTLGLPPVLEVALDDELMDRFNLIDPSLTPLLNRVTQLQTESGLVIVSIINRIEAEGDAFGFSEDLSDQLSQLREHLEDLQRLRKRILDDFVSRAKTDLESLRTAIPDRKEASKQLLARLQQASESELDAKDNHFQPLRGLDPIYFETGELSELPDQLESTVDDLQQQIVRGGAATQKILEAIDELLDQGDQLATDDLLERLREDVFQDLPNRLTAFSANVLELSLTQARARSESITLETVDIDPLSAAQVARLFRRDVKNARASLVDSWRLIEFNADDLESVLNIVFEGDIRNRGDNPLRLRDVTGRLGVGVQFDAPLTRLLERNLYREALISYQRARRAYYQVDDGVNQTLRGILRQIEVNKVNFELRRTALTIAVAQVQSARLALQAPPPIDAGLRGDQFSPTTARDLVRALNSLRIAQDTFLNEWIQFYINRGLLDLNMGTMRIDQNGEWIQPEAIGFEHGYPRREDLEKARLEELEFHGLEMIFPQDPPDTGEGEEIPAPSPVYQEDDEQDGVVAAEWDVPVQGDPQGVDSAPSAPLRNISHFSDGAPRHSRDVHAQSEKDGGRRNPSDPRRFHEEETGAVSTERSGPTRALQLRR